MEKTAKNIKQNLGHASADGSKEQRANKHADKKYACAPFVPPKRYACFDFDGTLADTPHGILQTAKTVLSEWGMTKEQQGDLTRLIGPPFPEAFELIYGLNAADAAEITRRYRDIYWQLGPEYFPLYAGVKEMLSTLKEAGVGLALTTSKQEKLAIRMSRETGIYDFFDVVCGNISGHGDKAELVQKSLERLGVDTTREDELALAVMVGDRSYDIAGALANKIDSIGVTYGAGSAQELLEAGASRLADTPAVVKELILGDAEKKA